MGNLHPLDVVVMAIYFLGVTGAGIYFAGRSRDTEAYFLGGRNFPAWALGLSLVGTSISSVSFLAYPGDAYSTAWLRLLPNVGLPIAVVIAAYAFLPFFRQGKLTSAYEYLELRFGARTRLYAASVFIIAQLFRIGMILYLLANLMVVLTDWNMDVCIIVCGIFVAFYTIAGGIEAVIWTDVAQTFVMLFGIVFAFVVVWWGLPGGFGQLFEIANEYSKFAFAEVKILADGTREVKDPSWAFSLSEKTALMMIAFGLSQFLAEYSSNQNVVQRYNAARSLKDARIAMLICVCFSIPIWAFLYFLGTSLFVYFQVNPDPEAHAILMGEGGRKAEQILPYFTLRYLPDGISGLVLAAVLAAAMSSIDSSINAISTVGVVDIYKRHLRPGLADKNYLFIARMLGVASGIFMIVLAMLIARDTGKTAQDTVTVINAVTAGGLLGLFCLGFLTTRGDGVAVGTGIAATFAFSAYMGLLHIGHIPESLRIPVDTYYTAILGHTLLFVIGYTLGLFASKRRDLTNLTIWTQGPAKAA